MNCGACGGSVESVFILIVLFVSLTASAKGALNVWKASDDAALDAAFVFTAQDSEVAVLALNVHGFMTESRLPQCTHPVGVPRVGDRPVGNAVVFAPSDQLDRVATSEMSASVLKKSAPQMMITLKPEGKELTM